MNNKRLRSLVAGVSGRFGKAYAWCPLLSAAMAARNEAAMHLIMEQSLADGIVPLMIDETILQAHLFLGFPAMIEASRLFATIYPQRHKRHHLPEAYSPRQCKEWNRKGMVKIRRLYGPVFDRLVPYINSFSPQILTWMINDGYGQVLSRPGLSFKLRELSVVAILTVTAYENQLRAHIRGAVNTGVDPALIAATIRNCRVFCPADNIRAARDILNGVVTI